MIKMLSYIAGALMFFGGLIMFAIKWSEATESTRVCNDPTKCGLVTHVSFTAQPIIGWGFLAMVGVFVIIGAYLFDKKPSK